MKAQGLYGAYGGRYVPETLIPALDELERGWRDALADESYRRQLDELAGGYAGRPTPLTRAERFAPHKFLYLKREDLLHRRHKLNNALARPCSRSDSASAASWPRPAGQHGVATATVCARFGLDCVVYMGTEDMRRQRPNVERMQLLGPEVAPVDFGTRTLKEATSEAIRDWITNVETTHYLIGSCVGPHPYPEIRPRAPVGAGARVAGAVSRAGRTPARRRRRLRRRRLERHRDVRGVRRRRCSRIEMKRVSIYLMCGQDTPALAEAAVEGGADLVELGFPFSDPLADGPVIRRAAERALADGMRTAACLESLARVRERNRRAACADDIRLVARGVRVRALRGGCACGRREQSHRRRSAGRRAA
jgi:hypothetical protein